jgi:hypothetical protein
MKPLFRPALPTSRRAAPLARPALGALLIVSAFGASAQTYTDGAAQWAASNCISCHVGTNVPLTLMQAGRYATTQAALNALNTAIQSQGSMAAFSSLSPTQRTNLAYFISNWRAEGNVSANPGPSLTVSAVGQTASTVITLFNNGRAPMTVLANNGVRLTGTGAAQFAVNGIGTGCQAQTLAANGGSCQVRVTYQPSVAPSPNHVATLTFEHNGEPQTTTTLAVSGSIAAAPPPAPTPAPTPAPSSDGGGGALPLALWVTLLPAALVARRRRD